MNSDISLVTITWSNENSFDIESTSLYKSFIKFNPLNKVEHFHFNRGHFYQEEHEFYQRFGQESDYILYKIHLLKQKVKQIDSEYIIFSDANDVVCLGNVNLLPSIYDLDSHIIVGAEKNQWPVPEIKLTWPGFIDYSGFDVQNEFYLNSGMVLAKRENFVSMLESMESKILSTNINTFKNDQAVYTWHYTANHEPKIKLDYQLSFAVNTFKRSCDEFYLNKNNRLTSKSTGVTPCFVHDNGWNHGSPKFRDNFNLKSLYE